MRAEISEVAMRWGVGLLVVIAALFVFGFQVGSLNTIPGHALVIVDAVSKTYYAPICLESIDRRSQSVVSCEKAKDLGFSPDPECREIGAFVQEGRSLSGSLLEKLGLLDPIESRWNDDGTWRY